MLRNSAPVVVQIRKLRRPKDGSEKKVMEAKQAKEQKQDSESQTELDARYGKIGISAVAAAVRHWGEQQRKTDKPRFTPYDCD